MKNLYHTIVLTITIGVCSAQSNFFDVPSEDTITAGKLFFQVQSSFSKEESQYSANLTFGLGHGFEAGFNLHQFVYNLPDKSWGDKSGDPGKQTDLLFNFQKIFSPGGWHRLGVGTRTGLNYDPEIGKSSITEFFYVNNRFSAPGSRHALTAGAWYGNRNYVGEGNNYGLMAGMQIALLKKFLSLQADFFSGNNAISYLNAGFNMWFFGWRLSYGVALPLPGSSNQQSYLIQISNK